MITLPSKIGLGKLADVLGVLGVQHDEGYVQMAALQSDVRLRAYPEVEEAVQEIASLRKLDPVYVMVNTMPPGQMLPWHQDWLEPTKLQPYKGPLIERWHLPVITNDKVRWFDSKEHPWGMVMPQGMWCGPVPYWNKHKVENLGMYSRVHLIVDLDCPEPMGMYE